MSVNVHCRLVSSPSSSEHFLRSSFLFPHHSNSTQNVQSTCSIYHDQFSPVFQQRRRLEDPVRTYASNYYVTNPQLPSPSSIYSSQSSSHQRSNEKNIYCDLYNLLERPSMIQEKKKRFFNYSKRTSSPKIILDRVKIKDMNKQQRSSNRDIFQRLLRNYFCMPITNFNGKGFEQINQGI